MLSNYYPRTDRDTLVKIDDIVINKAKAPRRNSLAYSFRCVGAVNPVDRSIEDVDPGIDHGMVGLKSAFGKF